MHHFFCQKSRSHGEPLSLYYSLVKPSFPFAIKILPPHVFMMTWLQKPIYHLLPFYPHTDLFAQKINYNPLSHSQHNHNLLSSIFNSLTHIQKNHKFQPPYSILLKYETNLVKAIPLNYTHSSFHNKKNHNTSIITQQQH